MIQHIIEENISDMPLRSTHLSFRSRRRATQFSSIKLFFLFALFFFSRSAFCQITAAFSYDPEGGCTPLKVTFTNQSTNYDSVLWVFGDGDSSNVDNPVHTFDEANYYRVWMYVYNTTSGTEASKSGDVDISNSPDLTFSSDASGYCMNQGVSLTYTGNEFDSLRWDFGDGVFNTSESNPISHNYTTSGTKTITLYSYNGLCADTSTKSVTIYDLTADFTQSTTGGCVGEEVTFEITSQSGVETFTWRPITPEKTTGYGQDTTPYSYDYDHSNVFVPQLFIEGGGNWCLIKGDTLRISRAEAVINYNSASEYCSGRNVYFKGGSSVTDDTLYYTWDFGNGDNSSEVNPQESFTGGQYAISLYVENKYGCNDFAYDTIYINELPVMSLGNDTTICVGDSIQLTASGGHTIYWIPATGLSNNRIYEPMASPEETTIYEPYVTDTITKCSSVRGDISQTITVIVPSEVVVSVVPTDTAIWLGGTATINADSLKNYNYSWSPEDYVNCVNCANPEISPISIGDNTYTLSVSDIYKCATLTYDVNIEVKEKYIIGVPEAFTPNGDGINDEIKVNGLGIESLVEFTIFNRWGKVVFTTDDITQGWDGTVNGQKQTVDTYIYLIKAHMYNDTEVEERGSFTLIR